MMTMMMCDRYYERRQKNNLAAKRSRESHKRNIETLERTAMQLEHENRYYTAQNRLLRAQVEHYQELLARPPLSVSGLKHELENFR